MNWKLFFIIYEAIALVFFILLSVYSELRVKEENSIFKYDVYKTNYFYIILISVFFPISILITAIKLLVEKLSG